MKRTTDPQPGKDTGTPDPDTPTEPAIVADTEPKPPGHPVADPPLQELTVPELDEKAAERGVEVTTGTGTDGAVVKADLVDALEHSTEPPVGRPPLITVAQAAAPINSQED